MPIFNNVFGSPNIEELKQNHDINGLIKALTYKESYIRWMAASALGELAGHFKGIVQYSRVVDTLCNMIQNASDTKPARWNAVRSLGGICACIEDTALLSRAVNVLSQALSDKDNDIRQAAAESLGKVNSKIKDVDLFTWAVQPLIRALDDKVGRVREGVIHTLAQLDELAVPPLLAALRHQQMLVREGAAEALGEMGWFPDKDADAAAYWIIRGKWDNCIPIGEEAVPELIASLRVNNPANRKSASNALVKIGLPATQPLIAALQDGDKDVRMIAAQTLEQLIWEVEDRQTEAYYWIARQDWGRVIATGQDGLTALLSFIKDEDRDIRRMVIHTLGNIYPNLPEPDDFQPALESLLSSLDDADAEVRQTAAATLGKTGAQMEKKIALDISRALLRGLNDASCDMRFASASALDQIGWKPDRSTVGASYWIARQDWQSVIDLGKAAVKPLLLMLQDESKAVREGAAAALDRLGWQPDRKTDGAAYWAVKGEWQNCIEIGAPAVKPLCASLFYRNIGGRNAAAHALGQIGMREKNQALQLFVINSLNKALYDEEVRLAAIQALGEIGHVQAVQALMGMLQEKESFEAASQALVKIGELAIPALINALKDPDDETADLAAGALVRFGDLALQPLLAALRNYESARSAAWVLEHIGWQADADEDGAYFHVVRREWEECVRIGAPAIDALMDAFLEGSESVRQAAAAALGDITQQIDDVQIKQKVAQTLISGFKDWDYGVRRRCAGALERLGWKPQADETGAAYFIIKRNWTKCVDLGSLAVPALIETLKDRDEQVRLAAAESLGMIGDKRAVNALVEALKDKGMRSAATNALRRIGSVKPE